MGASGNAILCLVVLAAPLAAAGQPLPIEDICTPVACTPRSCEPAVDCRADADPQVAACAVNLTIDGRTCQTHLGVEAERASEGTMVSAGVAMSDGSVDAVNLPNSWLSPSASVEASVLGTSLGRTSVGAYRSDIMTEGPRGGPYGMLAPSMNHTWTEVGVFVRYDDGVAREGILVSLWLLDMMPDGCFVRTQGGVQDTPCPSLAAAWNYVPALP